MTPLAFEKNYIKQFIKLKCQGISQIFSLCVVSAKHSVNTSETKEKRKSKNLSSGTFLEAAANTPSSQRRRLGFDP